MSFDQLFLFGLLLALFGMLLWGRFRYDAVAFSALIFAYIGGVVPKEDVFSGFGHPATIIVAGSVDVDPLGLLERKIEFHRRRAVKDLVGCFSQRPPHETRRAGDQDGTGRELPFE